MSTRVYVPTTLDGLAGFVLEGGIPEARGSGSRRPTSPRRRSTTR